MIPFTRLCPCKDAKAPLIDVCSACGDTGTVDVLDRLFRAIDNLGSAGLTATVGLWLIDAQHLANECEAIRSQEWMKAS